MSGRCPPTEALALLVPKLSGMEAAEKITRAIRENRCRLICDNTVVKSHIAAIATVVPKLEPDGRWIADIESTGPGLGWARGLNWELEVDEVMALLPNQKPRQKPGTKPKGNWPDLIRRELKRIGRCAGIREFRRIDLRAREILEQQNRVGTGRPEKP